jgi:hypothetical protein
MTDVPTEAAPIAAAVDQAATDVAAAAAKPSVASISTAAQDVGDLVSQPAIGTLINSSIPTLVGQVRRGWKTSEFWGVLAAAFANLGPIDLSSKDKVIATVLAVGYAVARGLAKIGPAKA